MGFGPWKPDVVIYHASCADGFGAAWAAWTRWGSDVEYIPANHGEGPPDVAGKHVLIGDFSYKLPVLEAMLETAASVVILDHHKTAEADLAPFARALSSAPDAEDVPALLRGLAGNNMPACLAVFDMNQSGARMVWDFCHEAPAPRLIELIEDRDIWRGVFPEAKEFALWLRSEPFAFERWTEISEGLNDPRRAELIWAEARAMQRFYDQKVTELVANARIETIAGHAVPVVNCPSSFASDIGNALIIAYPEAPFSACYAEGSRGKRSYSLRSENSRMDVSTVAALFGGGGHRNAAGFAVPAPVWPVADIDGRTA